MSADRKTTFSVLMLVVATLFWGMGFVWAKNVGDAVNLAAGRPVESALGPSVMLTGRFVSAALLWVIFFPSSLRGWTWPSVRRGCVLGAALTAGVLFQHFGLARSSEAVTAFLTNLTVVIVPILIAVLHRRLPRPALLIASGLAVAGIWLLTGARADGLTLGELYTIGCAVCFSVEIILVERLIPRDSVTRMTLAMFVFVAVTCAVVAVFSPGFSDMDVRQLASTPVIMQWVLLGVLVTFAGFGLMNTFQPQIDATRATIVYLFEPIFAALFAWMSEGAGMTRTAMVGAAIILLANVIAEIRWDRSKAAETAPD